MVSGNNCFNLTKEMQGVFSLYPGGQLHPVPFTFLEAYDLEISNDQNKIMQGCGLGYLVRSGYIFRMKGDSNPFKTREYLYTQTQTCQQKIHI